MKNLNPVAFHLQCPSCNSHDGFEYNQLIATCRKCKVVFDTYHLFEQVLTKMPESDLSAKSFSLISEFKLAPIHESLISDDDVKFKAFETAWIDLTKAGIPSDAKILYINITPYHYGDVEGPFLSFAYVRGNSFRSISDVPAIIGVVPYFIDQVTDLSNADLAKHLIASVFVRWCENLSDDIITDHLVRAAEAYWKKDLSQMVYNGFSTFELRLSNLLETFWKKNKNLSDFEYKDFFERTGVEKKMRIHIPLLCRELGMPYDDDVKRKLSMIDQMRHQRNSVVHSGQLKADKEQDKGKLFAGLCWALLFIKELETKL